MADSEVGRWVKTFATDIQPGDKIRFDGEGDGRRVIGRDYPPSFIAAFWLTYSEDEGRGVRKTDLVEIWDEDGGVSQRVLDITARGLIRPTQDVESP